MKALWIESAAGEVREVEYQGLDDLKRMIGGWIEVAKVWDNGDVLYVDEEGLLKATAHFFRLDGIEQPLGGNGVVVGRETGDTTNTDPPTMTVEQLRGQVRFLSREQADAWSKGNASEPAVSFTSWGPGQPPKTEVFARYGKLFEQMPKPTDETS